MRCSKFKHILLDLTTKGVEASPRGMKTKELLNYTYTLAPFDRFMNFPSRNLNIGYIKTELLWYLKGSLTDLSIVDKAKIWAAHVTHGKLFSNYGHYIYKLRGIDYVVECLAADQDSRRALITILGREHLYMGNNDVPCTVSLGFRIRNRELLCTVHMRSQDAVFGMGNDVPFFSVVQEMVLRMLQERGAKNLGLGPLTVFVESFHVYERHFDLLKALIYETIDTIKVPEITYADVVQLRDKPNAKAGKFSEWLLS